MSFLYDSAIGLWNTAASCFPAAAKYCEDNNISWTTTANLASEVGTIVIWGPLALAQETGKAALEAVANAIPALASRDIVSQAAHSALEAGTAAKGPASATMAHELASAAGIQALHLGYYALNSVYQLLPAKAVEYALEWSATLADLGDMLQGTVVFPGVDGAVLAAPAFHEGEDADGAAQHGDGCEQGPAPVPPLHALAALPDDCCAEDAALVAPWACITGACSAAPAC